MRIPGSGLRVDSPSFPLLQAHISYWGATSLNGNALGTTLVCADLDNWPTYLGLAIKVLDGPAAGQVRTAQTHAAGGIITVTAAFTNAAGAVQMITAGVRFCVLSIAGGGGAGPAPPPPTVSLWMFGVCDPGMAASMVTLVMPNLAGFPDDIFNNEFWVQVIHNDNAPGVAPEREIRQITDYVGATGTFTVDAFTANVEANDLTCVFHESIMGIEILGYGTLDASSATVPADSTRAENDDYFNGCLLMTTEGAVRFQPRRIVDYTGVGGIFTLDPSNPFSAVSGLVDYVIIGSQTEFVPGADAAVNRTPADVIGNKADTALQAATAVDSLMRYIKGLLLGDSRKLYTLDCWSAGLEEVQLDAAGVTVALPDITLADLPAGATVVKAIVMFKFRMIENIYAGVNKLNGATVATTSQVIQIRSDAPLAYVDAILFVDDFFTLGDAAREGGDVIVGTADVAGAAGVDENDTYNLRWLLGRADQDFINFNDCQVGLRIWYSV